jgi:hypothetical protein
LKTSHYTGSELWHFRTAFTIKFNELFEKINFVFFCRGDKFENRMPRGPSPCRPWPNSYAVCACPSGAGDFFIKNV